MGKAKASTARGAASLLRQGEKGEYSAGQGLFLVVKSPGSGSWIYRFQMNQKRQRLGLGSASAFSLAEARARAAELKAQIAQGINPLQQREREQAAERITFDMVAAEYIKTQRPGWKNVKHAGQWVNTLEQYVFPIIGHLPPAEITTEHVLEILKPIWSTKAETARRVRNRIERILNAAKVQGLRAGENPAAWRGHLEFLLTKAPRTKKPQSALPWPQVPEFWQALAKDTDISAFALRLTILTALRTSEVLNAQWAEFDLQANVWTIPGERTKTGKAHRVPLSQAALAALDELPRLNSGLLFEGRKPGKPCSNMIMLMKVRRMDADKRQADGIGWRDAKGDRITVHGFRSAFRDWTAENTNAPNIVAEQALGHAIGDKVEAAYRRGDLLERRRSLMDAWASFVTRPAVAKVIHLHEVRHG